MLGEAEARVRASKTSTKRNTHLECHSEGQEEPENSYVGAPHRDNDLGPAPCEEPNDPPRDI